MTKTLTYSLSSFAISDTGYVRKNNEDAWRALTEQRFFVLADGMGGHNAGEVAAELTVESLCESIQRLSSQASIEEACSFLRNAVSKANKKVFETAFSDPAFAGMGTTLSCFLIWEHHLIYAHVGDSRLYRYRPCLGLDQLTQDHSLIQNFYSKPKKSLPRHVITRAIGASPMVYPDIGVISLSPNDLYMLCSDGLSDYVAKKTLSQLLSDENSLEEMGRELIKAALEKGGNDNITLLLTKLLP